MAWIESHQTLRKHKKTLRAAGLLKIDRFKLIGHLHELWWWALDNVPSDGSLGDLSDFEIGEGADWAGDPAEFVEALTQAGFIDRTEDGRFLHDWYEYAGKWNDKRQKDRERAKDKRLSYNGPTTVAGPSQDTPTTVIRTRPDQTGPDNTHTDNPPTPRKRRGADVDYTPEFEQFWDTYLRKLDKVRAFKVWTARLRGGTLPTTLTQAAERYMAECRRKGTQVDFIMHPATFLGPNQRFDRFLGPPAEQTLSPNSWIPLE